MLQLLMGLSQSVVIVMSCPRNCIEEQVSIHVSSLLCPSCSSCLGKLVSEETEGDSTRITAEEELPTSCPSR